MTATETHLSSTDDDLSAAPGAMRDDGSAAGPRRPRRSFIASIERHPARLFAAIVFVTALLLVPFLAMAPTESASTEPGGSVFEARDRIDERFVSTVRPILIIAEHESGDLLRAEPLRELADAERALRSNGAISRGLYGFYDAGTQRQVDGVISIVDLIDRELQTSGSALDIADDADVARAAAAVIDRYGERSDDVGISALSTRSDAGRWIVPAVTMTVLTDDSILGFGSGAVNLGGDTDVEEFDRSVQEVIRNADGFQVNGVAIDVNLTSEEQGAVAGPFIGFTILAVLLIVGFTFRSYWILAVVGVLLVTLIVWLKGISNLIGLENDLVLSLIVPIAMVSFGVDFAFHSIGRYREERVAGQPARPAVVRGLQAVSGALLLALVSDSVAFLSNVSAGIDSIVQFGIGSAIALAAAYVLLGFVAPIAVSHIEHQVPVPTATRSAALGRVGASVGAAALAMTSVLLLVFILPWLGVVVAALSAVVTVVVPFLLRRRRHDGVRVGNAPMDAKGNRFATGISVAVSAVAARRMIVLPVAFLMSIGAGFLAVQVPAEFDVEDFFSGDTDFVESLDQLDVHVGDRGGETASIYVEGDLTDPARLAEVRRSVGAIEDLETGLLARSNDGRVDVDAGVFEVFDEAWESPIMAGLVAERTGVQLTDADGDGIPDSRDQVEALMSTASETGVPIDDERLAMTPDEVDVRFDLTGRPATRFELSLTDTRAQESILAVQQSLAPITADTSAALDESFVEATGGPIVRAESLEATNRALNLSLPIAVVLCLIVSTVFLRSFRYGLASIVPTLIVVAWLYAFMEVAGYAINLVTATIAAVSIGIGIDFAIHFISRYREELDRHGERYRAIDDTAAGTGVALVASACSSAVGFGILALAPMPLFAAYGLLTAIMIMMALVATLVVLPSVLVSVTRDSAPSR